MQLGNTQPNKKPMLSSQKKINTDTYEQKIAKAELFYQ